MAHEKGRKIRRNQEWAVDYDYLKKLTPDQRKFLADFTDEFYGGAVKKGDPKAIHNTDSLRKDAYARNNAANRDLLSVAAVTGRVSPLRSDSASTDGEDSVIANLDQIREETRRLELVEEIRAALIARLAKLRSGR